MRSTRPCRPAFALALMLTLCPIGVAGWPAHAAAQVDAQAQAPNPGALSPAEASDARIVDAATRAANQKGAIALADRIPALEAVVARTPKAYSKADERDGVIRYRARSAADYLAFTATRVAGFKPGEKRAIDWIPDVYMDAALLVGIYYNEIGQSDRALAVLGPAQAMAPDYATLLAETGAALAKLGRGPEALPLYDTALSSGDLGISDLDKARLLRAKGFVLTDMNRLDEAERAYRDSLKLEPDHANAKSELAYIAHLRAGGAVGKPNLISSTKAKTGQ